MKKKKMNYKEQIKKEIVETVFSIKIDINNDDDAHKNMLRAETIKMLCEAYRTISNCK